MSFTGILIIVLPVSKCMTTSASSSIHVIFNCNLHKGEWSSSHISLCCWVSCS
ncbi:hypothetical protein IHE45_18G079400 [Dioscorea alata]|uniref:Uncharacterized protein n=1 Tax=Dioscorea alata TaxID=55571 RepID=A0ACB7U879_DIOAL|nr:hypothetical protein IHE45_18G079400 [Dioscorea alata]